MTARETAPAVHPLRALAQQFGIAVHTHIATVEKSPWFNSVDRMELCATWEAFWKRRVYSLPGVREVTDERFKAKVEEYYQLGVGCLTNYARLLGTLPPSLHVELTIRARGFKMQLDHVRSVQDLAYLRRQLPSLLGEASAKVAPVMLLDVKTDAVNGVALEKLLLERYAPQLARQAWLYSLCTGQVPALVVAGHLPSGHVLAVHFAPGCFPAIAEFYGRYPHPTWKQGRDDFLPFFLLQPHVLLPADTAVWLFQMAG